MNKKVCIKSMEEMLSILENIFQSRTHLELGQNYDSIIKKSWSIIENINPHSYDMAIRPSDAANQFSFNSKSKISIATPTHSINFDVQLKKLNHKNLIIVNMPKELELLSTRLAKRLSLEHLDAEVKYRNLSVKSYKKRKQFMVAKIESLSNNGISYILPYGPELGFEHMDKIIISSINKYALPNQIEGKIVYLQDFKQSPLGAHTKIGVKFNNKIDMKNILRYLDNANYLNKLVA